VHAGAQSHLPSSLAFAQKLSSGIIQVGARQVGGYTLPLKLSDQCEQLDVCAMSDAHSQADRDDAREVVRGLALSNTGPLVAWSIGSDYDLVGTDLTTYAPLFSTLGPPRPTACNFTCLFLMY
jgi:hypothetical protein